MFVKNTLWRLLLLGVFVAGLWGVSAWAGSLQTLRLLGPAQQQPAPGFTLLDHHGSPLAFESLRGRGVVVRFWASW